MSENEIIRRYYVGRAPVPENGLIFMRCMLEKHMIDPFNNYFIWKVKGISRVYFGEVPIELMLGGHISNELVTRGSFDYFHQARTYLVHLLCERGSELMNAAHKLFDQANKVSTLEIYPNGRE